MKNTNTAICHEYLCIAYLVCIQWRNLINRIKISLARGLAKRYGITHQCQQPLVRMHISIRAFLTLSMLGKFFNRRFSLKCFSYIFQKIGFDISYKWIFTKWQCLFFWEKWENNIISLSSVYIWVAPWEKGTGVYANSKYLDQPVKLYSLIRSFATHR